MEPTSAVDREDPSTTHSASTTPRISPVLTDAYRRLERAGCETPELDAEVLLAHILGWNRARVLAHGELPLSALEQRLFREAVLRRAAREPLAYISGHREFYDLDFLVDRRVLVPRPETEVLVEMVLEWARKRLAEEVPISSAAPDHTTLAKRLRLADAGTGSGCIAVTLAVHLPQSTVWAIDASSEALEVAQLNASRCSVLDRVHLLQGNLLEPLTERVDAIVANLPYVASADMEALEPEIREYEPRWALDGGVDGLDSIGRLLYQAPQHLQPGGVLWLEIGADQGSAVAAVAGNAFPRSRVTVFPDYSGRDRVVMIDTRTQP